MVTVVKVSFNFPNLEVLGDLIFPMFNYNSVELKLARILSENTHGINLFLLHVVWSLISWTCMSLWSLYRQINILSDQSGGTPLWTNLGIFKGLNFHSYGILYGSVWQIWNISTYRGLIRVPLEVSASLYPF